MGYSVDELFEFNINKTNHTASVWEYLKRDDPDVLCVEIPSEYHGYPVTYLEQFAFGDCKYLREVFIPDSVTVIAHDAFYECGELRTVRLPKDIDIRYRPFVCCRRLDPKIILAGLVCSNDIVSKPLEFIDYYSWDEILREDVFALAIKYDSFREFKTEGLFEDIVTRGRVSHFEMLEKAGKSPSAEQTDELINLSAENGKTEMTAYLLDLKNRKFGFDGGNKFEL
ncbi:MAG: leucine-rich repeat domain-containing protein [Oscillospiraceae bacterium]|nr:leucine-rich repeat domain-containing protein [Oscillospiraceae bacterium]